MESSILTVVITNKDTSLLQNYLLKLAYEIQPTKCFTMTFVSRKPTSNLYTFCGQQLTSVESHCYIGMQISNTLNWTVQCNSVARKVQQALGVIRNLY